MPPYRIPPKIAVINSFAGYGRCSTTEALPIISAMKVQACPVPTSIFSNHTGFSTHYSVDFTEEMSGYLNQWNALGLVFDGIYCGFLGKKEQIPIVSDFICAQKNRGCSMILLDPVMGDHGKAYRTIKADHCSALKDLARLADIITPNITEACLLTGTPYKDCWQEDELQRLCQSLHALGPEKIVITGLHGQSAGAGDDSFLNFISIRQPSGSVIKTAGIVAPSAGPSRHGTGDIFASVVAADAVLGNDFPTSVKKAAGFISTCIRASQELGIPECEGVCFENFLDRLS